MLLSQFCHETYISDDWLNESSCCNSFSLDTEWKSDLINSRHFDEEIGHQNPRCSLYYHSALFLQHKEVSFFLVFACRSSFIAPLNLSAMAVESVTVVAPEVRVGPFVLSKGPSHERTTDTRSPVTLLPCDSEVTGVLCVICRSCGDDRQLSDSEPEGLHCHQLGPLPQYSRRLFLPHSNPSQARGELGLLRCGLALIALPRSRGSSLCSVPSKRLGMCVSGSPLPG